MQGGQPVIVVSGAWTGDANGASLSAAAFESTLPGIGGYVVSIGLSVFAFTTIIGWSYYGERCVEYLFGVGQKVKGGPTPDGMVKSKGGFTQRKIEAVPHWLEAGKRAAGLFSYREAYFNFKAALTPATKPCAPASSYPVVPLI